MRSTTQTSSKFTRQSLFSTSEEYIHTARMDPDTGTVHTQYGPMLISYATRSRKRFAYMPLLFRLVPLCWCHTASTCKLKESWLDKQTPISYCICTLECNLLRQAKLRDRASLLTINFNFCCLHVFTSDQAITFYRPATHRLSSIARTLLGLQGMCGTPLLGLQKKQCTTGSPIFSIFDCTPTCSGHTLTLCQIDQRPTVIHPLNTHTTQWSHMLPVLQWNLSTVVTI